MARLKIRPNDPLVEIEEGDEKEVIPGHGEGRAGESKTGPHTKFPKSADLAPDRFSASNYAAYPRTTFRYSWRISLFAG
jgi:hypothetical protein